MDRVNYNSYNAGHYYSQTPQEEDGQYTSLHEAGQTSARAPASGAPGSSNPQPAVEVRRRKTPAQLKEHFLAGLEAFGQGALLKDCSSSIRFRNYINDNGEMVRQGIPLYNRLTPAEKMQLDQAIIARQGAKLFRIADEEPVEERFLAGLGKYEQGARLKDCSATLELRRYVSSNGSLQRSGKELFKNLPPEGQERINQVLLSRSDMHLARAMTKETVEERFLAGLAKYAEGAPLNDCSATLEFGNYVFDNGTLHPRGEKLRDSLPLEDQERINNALLARRDFYDKREAADNSTSKRFLASLEKYKEGLFMSQCAEDFRLNLYVTDDGRLQPERGQPLYNKLSQEDKVLVDRALTTRREVIAQHTVKDADKFMATLEPYANGLDLLKCGKWSGLKRKAITYFTPEGGLKPRGKLLVEKLQSDQRNEVFEAIAKRQRRTELNPQVPEPPWQRPEMPSSMPEMPGMNPTAMADPMQTEAMWATTWQLTGQAVPGPSDPIPYYGSEAVTAAFQHQYGSHGLMPQSAQDRLIGQGIVGNTRINIQGEVSRVQGTESSGNPTNENP
ncbi:MAG: hypothetical protein P8X74_19700 [Reinekea sp.]